MARISDVQYKKQSKIDGNDPDEAAAYFQNCNPPPAPPGGDDMWELQYCRWWGWNWVKRQQQPADQYCGGYQCETHREQNCDRSKCPPICPQQRKVKKKHIWDLCKFLCCKKKKKVYPCLQSMYTTPSNSTTICKINKCGVFNDDTFVDLEEQRNISRKERTRSPCKRRKDRKRSMVRVKHEWSGSSSVEYTCGSTRPRSSTEESIEFINVTCGCRCQKGGDNIEDVKVKAQQCPCQNITRSEPRTIQPNAQVPICRQKCGQTESDLMIKQIKDKSCRCNLIQQQPKCCDCQTQTIVEEPTQSLHTAVRKKRKLVVTCHCCCCKCLDSSTFKASKFNQSKSICDCSTCDRKQKNKQYIDTRQKPTRSDMVSAKIPNTSFNECQNNQIQNRVLERIFDNPFYIDKYLPWNAAGYSKKTFPKHGVAQINHHPWLQQTQSDISDRIHSFRLDDEFTSPVSGKKYNVSPLKVNNMDAIIQKKLPEPLEVSDEVQYFRKLESEAKMDMSSRVVMDAVCDAILRKNQDVECFSTLLNQVNYDQKSVGERIASIDDLLIRKSTNDLLLNSIYRDINTTDKTEPDTNSNLRQQNPSENIVNEVDKLVDRLLTSNKSREDVMSKEVDIFQRYGLQKAFDVDDNSDFYHEINLRNNYKRSASPIQFKEHSKKLKTMENNIPDLNDIFQKIDEIAMKSKQNDIRINQVLGSIRQDEIVAGSSTNYDSKEYTNQVLDRINDFQCNTSGRGGCAQIEAIVRGGNVIDDNIQTEFGEDVEADKAGNRYTKTVEDHSRSCSKSRKSAAKSDSKDMNDELKKKGNKAHSMIPIKKSSRMKSNKKK